MKVAKLVHNPKAGDEGHGKDELILQIKAAGVDCRYSSTKGWNWSKLEGVHPKLSHINSYRWRSGDRQQLTAPLLVADQQRQFGMHPLEEDIDFVVVAGGDGTVRQITKELLNRKVLNKTFPVALLLLK